MLLKTYGKFYDALQSRLRDQWSLCFATYSFCTSTFSSIAFHQNKTQVPSFPLNPLFCKYRHPTFRRVAVSHHGKMVTYKGNINLLNPTIPATIHKHAYITHTECKSSTIYLDVIFNIMDPFLNGMYYI
jgi:hypothetical protein